MKQENKKDIPIEYLFILIFVAILIILPVCVTIYNSIEIISYTKNGYVQKLEGNRIIWVKEIKTENAKKEEK